VYPLLDIPALGLGLTVHITVRLGLGLTVRYSASSLLCPRSSFTKSMQFVRLYLHEVGVGVNSAHYSAVGVGIHVRNFRYLIPGEA